MKLVLLIKKIPNQDPFKWGPEQVHFGEAYFRDLNIDARIFKTNYKNQYQAQLFYQARAKRSEAK